MTDAPAKPNRKVTLKDVADAANVSTATASLVLRDSPRISAPTVRRVLDAVESLGYVYNQRAASLRTQRSFTIGLIIKDVSNPFNAELTSGAEAHLTKEGYSLLLATTGDAMEPQNRLTRTMLERDVDGLILSPSRGTPLDALRKLMRYCPLALLSPYYPDLQADCVGMDDEAGTARAIEHLVAQGHRRIAFVGGFEETGTRQMRLRSYQGTLRRHGIACDPDLVIASPVSRQGGYDAARQLLDLPQPPAAAFCFGDVIAFGFMLGLRAAGIEPGRDFGVTGFDNVAESSLWQPALTTVATDATAMGEQAARLMLRRLAEPDLPVQRVIMPSWLVARESSAAN